MKTKGGVVIYRRIEDVKETIVVFRPTYNENGDMTEIFFLEDGELKRALDRRAIKTSRQSLARSFNLDLAAQGQELKKLLHRKFPLPFYLPDGRVFIPLKMRIPTVIGDKTYGYAELSQIKSVRRINDQVKLLLYIGAEIPVYSTANAAYNSINLGKEVWDHAADKIRDEQDKVLDALSILLDKIYKIERILDKY